MIDKKELRKVFSLLCSKYEIEFLYTPFVANYENRNCICLSFDIKGINMRIYIQHETEDLLIDFRTDKFLLKIIKAVLETDLDVWIMCDKKEEEILSCDDLDSYFFRQWH